MYNRLLQLKRIIILVLSCFVGKITRYPVLFTAILPFNMALLPLNAIPLTWRLFKKVLDLAKPKDIPDNQPEVSEEEGPDNEPVVSEEDNNEFQMMSSIFLVSIPLALLILGRDAKFFRSQLGLPEKDSDEFKKMKPEFQTRMEKFYPKEDALKQCGACVFNPIKGNLKRPIHVIQESLDQLLNEMQQLSLDILDEEFRVKEKEDSVTAQESEV